MTEISKTLQARKDLADEIQSRLNIMTMLELNDKITREKAKLMVEYYLREKSSVPENKIMNYSVVCDATINTPDVIDRHLLRLDTYIQEEGAPGFHETYKTMYLVGRQPS